MEDNDMKHRLFIIPFVFALALALTGHVLADTSGTGTATANIRAGSLSVSAQNISLAATLDGTDQTVYDTDSATWTAADATGSGSGWHITIGSTNFVSGSDTIAYSNFKVKVDDTNILVVDGNDKPTSSITSYTAFGADAATLMSAAAGKGMGNYTFVPDFSLDVAAETLAHSDYTATVTVNIISGP
jgi:hypothetical protein